jgi:DNA-binding MarR family transcriptional regulator
MRSIDASEPIEASEPSATLPSPASGPGRDAVVEEILTELEGAIRELRCASTERMVREAVSMTQVHVLWLLDHHGEMPMSRLAESLDVSLSNATGIIDRMAERGLVDRVRVPDDRRLVVVRLAEGGQHALDETDGMRRDRIRAALARLGPLEQDRLRLAMRDIHAAIASELASDTHHHHNPAGTAD